MLIYSCGQNPGQRAPAADLAADLAASSHGGKLRVNNRQLPDAPEYYSTVINPNHIYLQPDQNDSSKQQRGSTIPLLRNVLTHASTCATFALLCYKMHKEDEL